MQDYNKKNLKRLIALFTAVMVAFLSIVTVSVSLKWWWASIPTSGAALASAIILFVKKFIQPDK